MTEIGTLVYVPQRSATMRPRSPSTTAHQFNVVPLTSDKRILVVGWYNGGTHVLDFTDPANVERIGHYIPHENGRASAWASYWYNGYIYTNNFVEGYVPPIPNSRGFHVFQIDHPVFDDAITLDRLNPYTQEPLPTTAVLTVSEEDEQATAAPADDDPPLPATGGGSGPRLLAGLLILAATGAIRRSRRLSDGAA